MTRSESRPQHQDLGPYRLDMLLGEGGMGEVYKAYDDRLGRWVAAKRLRGDATAKARGRFRREARTLAQLGHPAIVQVFDIVAGDDGDWIVMELVAGPTLAELRRDGPLEVGLALEYARQIASALEAAHASGIVHRDLKTENVMVLPSGHVKVLDFGLARRVAPQAAGTAPAEGLQASADGTLSQPGDIVGTPRAMSPEQATGGDVDERSDLFSLGVLLHEILTARSPFAGRTVAQTLARVITHTPPPVRQLNPRVPPELSEMVDRLLEKYPAQRPQSAAVVAAELAAIAAIGAGAAVRPVTSKSLSQAWTLDEDTASIDAFDDGAAQDDAVVATLFVSGLTGSERLASELAGGRAAALVQRHDQLVCDLLQEHDGREIEAAAASLTALEREPGLLLFDRPWNAVGYARAYHEGLGELALAARVGIHLGEVILYRNTARDVERGAKPVEVEGSAKSIAARLMALAAGGQTLLTRAAYEVTRRSTASMDSRGLRWLAHGSYRFEGIGEDFEVFEVGVPGQAPLTAPAGSGGARRVTAAPPAAASPAADDLPALPPRPVTLRSWPAPELPEQPYPVLLPYTHSEFMAGRDQELARLRRLLEMPVPILGLSAPSGTGKSSLLVGALVPALRAAGRPVALVRHPAEAGVASRLIADLLVGVEPLQDADVAGFVERLAEAERLAGVAPVLALDQFEDVLCKPEATPRIVLGTLMAASVARRPGLAAPPCRWLVAYRQELYGRLSFWLDDVLADARAAGVAEIAALPHDLSQPDRFHSMTLPPLATPSPGGRQPLAESTEVFLAAIEKPLAVRPPAAGSEDPALFSWHFRPGHAERLARAFAEARLARPDAPLAPELQVVLAQLLAEAGPGGDISVPDNPDLLIEKALGDHLRRALEAAFPAAAAASPTRRARALLALRELATSSGQREEGLRPDDLARAIGDDGEAILEKLATPLTRLVVVRQTPDGLRWVLAHDRMAEAVVRLVEEEGRSGQLVVDSELLALRRFVTLRTALFRSGEEKTSTRVPRRQFRRIANHSDALLGDDERRAWFKACRRRRRADRRRLRGLVSVAVLVLAVVGWGAWSWARRLAENRALLDQVVGGEPDMAFQAVDRLAARPDADLSELLLLLRRREGPMDVLERGLGGFEGERRSAAVLRAVEIALPWVEETPEDPVLIANLAWALDHAPGRDPRSAERARALRDRVLAPLRRLRPPPPLPAPEDPDWIRVGGGSFVAGMKPGEPAGDEEPPRTEVTVSPFRMQRHEVTGADYRRLVPGHPDAGAGLPAAAVSWYAAYAYAAWLGGRLPTEAEWEYAARADCGYPYCAADGRETTVDAVAWTLRSSRDAATGEPALQPVKRLAPNPWGFYDMLGNLWEWTADWYGEYPEGPRRDPWGPVAGEARVFRGGSFWIGAAGASLTFRFRVAPGSEDPGHGLRVVLPEDRSRARPAY